MAINYLQTFGKQKSPACWIQWWCNVPSAIWKNAPQCVVLHYSGCTLEWLYAISKVNIYHSVQCSQCLKYLYCPYCDSILACLSITAIIFTTPNGIRKSFYPISTHQAWRYGKLAQIVKDRSVAVYVCMEGDLHISLASSSLSF